jgi:hypothetical protein
MMFDCRLNFATSYINNLSALFVLSNDDTVVFNDISINCDSDFEFDGQHNTITIELKTVSELTQVDEGVIIVNIRCHLDLVGIGGEVNYEQKGVLKKMYFGL